MSGIVEADETFILESFKGRWSDLPRKARKRGGKARHPGSYQDNIPVLVARDRKGATFDAVLPQDDNASIAAALTGVVTAQNHLVGDGGKPLATFARLDFVAPDLDFVAPGFDFVVAGFAIVAASLEIIVRGTGKSCVSCETTRRSGRQAPARATRLAARLHDPQASDMAAVGPEPADQPKHDEDDHDQAQHAAEPGPP